MIKIRVKDVPNGYIKDGKLIDGPLFRKPNGKWHTKNQFGVIFYADYEDAKLDGKYGFVLGTREQFRPHYWVEMEV